MRTYRFAVIGNPIAHSISPAIHSEFARQFGLRVDYSKLIAPLNHCLPIVQEFLAQGGHGLNVTAPFKHDAFAWAVTHDKAAQLSRVVNTLANLPTGIKGFNTDGAGFMKDLIRLGWDTHGAEVLILGAGGACRGILGPLLASGARVTIANRTSRKAEQLSSLFPGTLVSNLDRLPDSNLIINAISAQSQDLPVVLPHIRFRNAWLYDLNYSVDGPTPFLRLNAPDLAHATDGTGMLIEQAAESFRIWTGCDPETQPIHQLFRNSDNIRRYIAGAKCPVCGALDRVYVLSDKASGRQITRGCAACGDFPKSHHQQIKAVRI